jgi:hypothetical protein
MAHVSSNSQLDRLLPPDPAAARPELPLPMEAAAAGLPERLPAHLARKLQEIPGDRSRQLAGLVAAAVEWGLDDHQVLALALHHRPTEQRRQAKGTDVAADVARLLGKHRPAHPHLGRPCDLAGCPNTPPWMTDPPAEPATSGNERRPRSSPTDNGSRPPTTPPPASSAPPTASAGQVIDTGGADLAVSAGSGNELLELLSGYVQLDDPGHIWFTLAVAVSAALDGDPLWGMLIGPSSSGKTEAVRALDRLAEPIDELTAPALLSWTQGKAPRPTGVLTRIGQRGLVTVGDFSTVLATSDRGGRDQLFALLRRAYDGQVTRDLGNAPVPLRWSGRLTLLAACTPAIDNYASHNDQLGPRWLYYRLTAGSSQAKRAASRKARLRPGDLGRLRSQAAQLAAQLVTAAQPQAATLMMSESVAERLDDLAIVCCFGRASVPRNAYGRREIEGLAIIEEPPRLVGQLLLLAKGLLALGLPEPATMGLCRRAALDSIPQVRRRLLQALATVDEVTVSEAARRVGCDRRVARMGLEELAAIGLAACPALDDQDQEELEEAHGRWSAHPWQLAGPDAALVRAVVAASAWDEVWGASPGLGAEEEVGWGGGVGGRHTSSQARPATSTDHTSPRTEPEELVCPACGQLTQPLTDGSGRCPDCAVGLLPVDPQQQGGADIPCPTSPRR